MKTKLTLGLIAAGLLTYGCAEGSSALKTEKDRLSYTVGSQIGQNLKRQKMDIDAKVIGEAIQDNISGTPRMTDQEMQEVIQAYQKQEMEKHEELAKKSKATSEAFLEANKKKEGVIVLPSGVQYKVLQDGKGKQPKTTDLVTVNYRGTLIDGTEFDSSYKRNEPATFGLNSVIKGWQEVLPMMKEGAKWEVTIPSDSAYGPRGRGGPVAIEPNSALVFEIELVSTKDNQAKAPDKKAVKKVAPKNEAVKKKADVPK